MDDRTRWNEKYRAGQGPDRLNARLQKYMHLLKPGRALDLASGIGQNSTVLAENGWDVILCDIADEALARAPAHLRRVQVDALALPFPPNTFDTIISTYFYEPRVDYAALLALGGTLFLETYTVADISYRPDFNKAYRLDPAEIHNFARELQIVLFEETDDGHRVFGTLIASKP